jgi:ribonuclease D
LVEPVGKQGLAALHALINRDRDLALLLEVLAAQPAVAVDTESNSLYAYQERICLIQLSIPAADFLVDPLAGLNLQPLGEIFADPAIQKVFHAADQDVAGLKRDFRFRFSNLFDTMWAGRILGWPRVGLGAILEELFSVKANKRYQRYNWGERPLRPEALAYARLDVHYLLPLRDRQIKELAQAGRSEEAGEVFEELAQTAGATSPYGPEAFWRVKGAQRLRERERAVLWELYLWRDRVAQARDRPPFKVISDMALVALARSRPRAWRELEGIAGLTPYLIGRYGRALLSAVQRGEQGPAPRFPRRPRPPSAVLERYRALQSWRKELAAARGVDPDVILSNATLQTLARQNPATLEDMAGTAGLSPWKHRVYGPEILRVLGRTR